MAQLGRLLDEVNLNAPAVQPVEIAISRDQGRAGRYRRGGDPEIILALLQASWARLGIELRIRRDDGRVSRVYAHELRQQFIEPPSSWLPPPIV